MLLCEESLSLLRYRFISLTAILSMALVETGWMLLSCGLWNLTQLVSSRPSSRAAAVPGHVQSFVVVVMKKKKTNREMPILLNASKGLCLAPVLGKSEIYWSLCVRRKSGSGYQIAHQRQVLM